MKVFTIVKNVTGEGKDLKTEYQIAGNVNVIQAQQMLTEYIMASAKAEVKREAKVVAEKTTPAPDKPK